MSWLSKLLGYVSKEERKGISLENITCWKISPVENFPNFLRALVDLVPAVSTLYLEGGSPKKQIRVYMEERAAKNTTKVAMGTIWPRPQIYHIPITKENLEGLAKFAEKTVSPEICVHLHVYKDKKVLLEWYDAFFTDPFYASKEIEEDKVKEFCKKLKTNYEEVIRSS